MSSMSKGGWLLNDFSWIKKQVRLCWSTLYVPILNRFVRISTVPHLECRCINSSHTIIWIPISTIGGLIHKVWTFWPQTHKYPNLTSFVCWSHWEFGWKIRNKSFKIGASCKFDQSNQTFAVKRPGAVYTEYWFWYSVKALGLSCKGHNTSRFYDIVNGVRNIPQWCAKMFRLSSELFSCV